MKKENISYQDKLNELKFDVSHPNSKKILFILVEGDTDVRFFRKIFEKNCKVENITGGNSKVELAVAELLQKHHLVIGIRDADFIHLNKIEYNKPNMFLTDFHDIEMMLVANDKVLDAILVEFSNIQKDEHNAVRKNLIKSINKLSLLKWLNFNEILEFKFEIGFVNLLNFDDVNNLTFDFSQYFSNLLSKSPNAKITNLDDILPKLEILAQQNPDILQLCNGHDFMNVFADFLRKKGNKGNIKNDFLESSFRMIYTKEDFEKTILYQNIKKWAERENIEI